MSILVYRYTHICHITAAVYLHFRVGDIKAQEPLPAVGRVRRVAPSPRRLQHPLGVLFGQPRVLVTCEGSQPQSRPQPLQLYLCDDLLHRLVRELGRVEVQPVTPCSLIPVIDLG